ncbi:MULTISPECIES: helix-turn-helix domain-containing protein [unclassified Acidithiobacillus]|uniref:helix-turn-helix domain-containing protein n=1 Tax=unclassified Acidithiobacillus TaxID=2614800 RepID=UPI001D0CF290|nr:MULTISPECIES: helix-turn-helix domain-containing protein [unclassified Acidithiobacillus]
MPNRKVTYRLYPNAEQEVRLQETLGLHQRLYNTALEERIRVYKETGKGLSFADQCKVLTQWRKMVPALAGLNAQSEQVTLKRLHLAFQHFFRRMKNGETPGFPRFKNIHRYPGWGYKTHGDGWKLHLGISGKHGALYLQFVGNLPIRGKPRTPGRPVTCEIMHKAGKWYASVTLEAGSWYEEAPTREIKPTQRCHACWKLPDEKKTLSNREHQCPHCGVICGRDENADLVLLRWLEMRLAGGSGSGREPSEMWSGGSFAAMKHETHAIAV